MMDQKHLFKFTRWLMIASGTWQMGQHTSSFLKSLYRAYSIATQIIYDSVIFMFLVKLYELYGVENEKAAENLSRLIFVILLIMKLSLCKSNSMIALLNKGINEESAIFAIKQKAIQKIYQRHVLYSNVLTGLIVVCSTCLAIYLIEMDIVSYNFNKIHGLLNDSSKEKPLSVEVWYPFDKNHHYITVMTHQIIEIMLTAIYSGSVHALSNSVMIYIRAQLKILQHCLRNFHNYPETEKFAKQDFGKDNLEALISKHLRLIRWTQDFNQLFKNLLLMEYSVTSLLLATVIFQIIAGSEVIFNCIYLVLIICQLMALAWNANEIIEESIKLSTALYESEWYTMSRKVQNMVYFMIFKCQHPINLNIGPFGMMNIQAALSRFKLAYSYVSLVSS